jgi:hypothetical protein
VVPLKASKDLKETVLNLFHSDQSRCTFFRGGELDREKGVEVKRKGRKREWKEKRKNIFRSRENTGKRMSGEYKYVYRGNENIVLRGRGG